MDIPTRVWMDVLTEMEANGPYTDNEVRLLLDAVTDKEIIFTSGGAPPKKQNFSEEALYRRLIGTACALIQRAAQVAKHDPTEDK
jgi:hypothetical protein